MPDIIPPNNITNNLLLKYDDKFNKNYNKLVQINSSISNKEELITKENDLINQKDNNILLLKYIITYLILSIITYTIHKTSFINFTSFLVIIITLFIIMAILYYKYYIKNQYYTLSGLFGSVGAEMIDYVKNDILDADLKPYTCPSKCSSNNASVNDGNIGSHSTPEYNVNLNSTPTLNIDPSTNVWKFGDVPEGGYLSSSDSSIQQFYNSPTDIQSYYNENNEPHQRFGTTYPNSVYYKCEWMGASNEEHGLPNTELSTYTTIPCSYRPNFKQTGKYICNNDPNLNGITDCSNVSEIYS